MPSFGPDSAAIMTSGSDSAFEADGALPFEVIPVTANTLPSQAVSYAYYPAELRVQELRDTDETVSVGDLLEIQIREVAEDGLFATAGNRETVLNVQVSNSGQIAMPYAGTLEARGLTVSELRSLLLERYQGLAVEPEISVAISATEARSATILGSVRAPGRITVPSRGIRLLDLLAQGGGASHAPWELTVLVQRAGTSASISLSDITSNVSNNIVIFPGDTINVEYNPRRFAVYGGVSRASNIEIPSQDATLAYLLAEAGGLNDRVAQARSVFVFRPAASGAPPTAYQFDFSRPDALLLAGAFQLEPSDITYVASADAADFQRFVSTHIPQVNL